MESKVELAASLELAPPSPVIISDFIKSVICQATHNAQSEHKSLGSPPSPPLLNAIKAHWLRQQPLIQGEWSREESKQPTDKQDK